MLYGTFLPFSWHNNKYKRGVIMKKILIIFASLLLLVSLSGCKSEVSAEDVSKAIADIYSDSEGNVTISLSDGREFNLGNMKGEKGDKGDKGDPGVDGKDGKDGLNGLNGKDGINGADGKDGANGKDGTNGTNGRDGADASPITDYVKDVTFTDENVLTVTYGDGTIEELDRIAFSGQYILKAYVDLYDAEDNYVDTVLAKYFCYEEGNDMGITVDFPIEYNGKYYACIDYEDFPEDLEVVSGGIGLTGAGFDAISMPARNIDFHFYAKEAYNFELQAKCLNGTEYETIYTSGGYIPVGDSGNFIYSQYYENLGTTYYCEDIINGRIDNMPDHDISVEVEYIPLYNIYSGNENPYPDSLLKMINYMELTDIEVELISTGSSTILNLKNKISEWLDSNGFDSDHYSIQTSGYFNDSSTFDNVEFEIYPVNDYNAFLTGRWVNPKTDIIIKIK